MYPISSTSMLALALHLLNTCALPNPAEESTPSVPLIPRNRQHAWIGEFNVKDCTDAAIAAHDPSKAPLWPKGLKIDARPKIYNGTCIAWHPAFVQEDPTSVGVWWGQEDEAISQVKIYSGSSECDGSDKTKVKDTCCDDKQLLGLINKNDSGTVDFGANENYGFDGACVDGEYGNKLWGMKYFRGFA
ncbi:MAG: hypothetical protein OHK93_003767 [Ramalina farinacea]|uniref:Ecp2 effector protein domain-containing protein n=1 Tax=Ramalina farinacea TaxID=258253 RepID=A0AA43QTX8_9LECA|nr:hypothetical protein [Ramalina farinacea]